LQIGRLTVAPAFGHLVRSRDAECVRR
jgi:hypothetical protein